jgi:hypothetical protein
MISVDVVCWDSNLYVPPIWNDIQAQSLNNHPEFRINNIFTTAPSHKLNQTLFRESQADILISICPDQHPFGFSVQDIQKYKKIVFIEIEPIYNTNAMGLAAHNRFISECKGVIREDDVIYYCSNLDRDLSQMPCVKKSWHSGLNLFFPKKPARENKKMQIITDASVINAWNGRKCFFDKFNSIENLTKIMHVGSPDWGSTSQLISESKIYLIPPHPLIIHWLRFSRALHLGALPVVVNYDGWLEDKNIQNAYEDIINENGKTCLLTNLGEFDKTIELLRDEDYVDSLLDNIYNKDLYEYSIESVWNNLYKHLKSCI